MLHAWHAIHQVLCRQTILVAIGQCRLRQLVLRCCSWCCCWRCLQRLLCGCPCTCCSICKYEQTQKILIAIAIAGLQQQCNVAQKAAAMLCHSCGSFTGHTHRLPWQYALLHENCLQTPTCAPAARWPGLLSRHVTKAPHDPPLHHQSCVWPAGTAHTAVLLLHLPTAAA
jgi:hypothetical protein